MSSLKFFLVGLIFILAPIFVSADFQAAMQNYQKENYEVAYTEFESLAEIGNAEAIYNIGVMHYKGQFVKKDIVQAYVWMKLANSFDEYFKYSVVEKEIPENKKKDADIVYKKLNIEYGVKTISENYKPIFSNVLQRVSDEYPQILPILKIAPIYPPRAAERGREGIVLVSYEVLANGSVANVELVNQNPIDKDFTKQSIKAAKKFKYRAVNENRTLKHPISKLATNRFSFSLSFNGSKNKKRKKLSKIIAAVQEGSNEAQYLLAVEAPSLYGAKLDEEKKLELLLVSATNGHAKSQLELGFKLLNGNYCKVDIEKATKWIIKAAESGDEYAKKLVSRYSLLDEVQ